MLPSILPKQLRYPFTLTSFNSVSFAHSSSCASCGCDGNASNYLPHSATVLQDLCFLHEKSSLLRSCSLFFQCFLIGRVAYFCHPLSRTRRPLTSYFHFVESLLVEHVSSTQSCKLTLELYFFACLAFSPYSK